MTLIDRKQSVKNYVDNANKVFLSMIENIIASLENEDPDVQPFTPEQ